MPPVRIQMTKHSGKPELPREPESNTSQTRPKQTKTALQRFQNVNKSASQASLMTMSSMSNQHHQHQQQYLKNTLSAKPYATSVSCFNPKKETQSDIPNISIPINFDYFPFEPGNTALFYMWFTIFVSFPCDRSHVIGGYQSVKPSTKNHPYPTKRISLNPNKSSDALIRKSYETAKARATPLASRPTLCNGEKSTNVTETAMRGGGQENESPQLNEILQQLNQSSGHEGGMLKPQH